MTEYIIEIEEDQSDESEIFIGWIRRHSKQLIRCKDCKFATCIEQNENWWECKHDKRVNHSNGYCNWAERKEE